MAKNHQRPMVTVYRSFRHKTAWRLLWMCPGFAALGGWLIFERIRGVALQIGSRGGASHAMSSSEQTALGLFFIVVALSIPLLGRDTFFRRLEWGDPRIRGYDWRNRIEFDENVSELQRLTRWTDGLNRDWHTVYGARGSFRFPASWKDSSQLVDQIAEAVEANVATDRARLEPR